MATVKGALALYDGMTGPLKNIHDALNIVLNSFESVQSASENVMDVSAIQRGPGLHGITLKIPSGMLIGRRMILIIESGTGLPPLMALETG